MFKRLSTLAAMLTVLLTGSPALAVKIADVTRLYGQQNNILTGIGLVYGLKGSGDGGDFLPAMRPLQAMLAKYYDESTIAELAKAQNVALVTVTARLPTNGVRKGDRLDAFVMSMGAASSLRGGRLVITPLVGRPGQPEIGNAEGAVTLEDPATPTVGVLKGGLIINRDLEQPLVQNGDRITLVVDDTAASWGLSSTIAKLINEEGSTDGSIIAFARDPRTVEVNIPQEERAQPDGFIARIQRLQLPVMPQEARVIVNTKTATMIVTGDVEISPVVISYKGLTITTVQPKPVATPRTPQVISQTAIPVATDQGDNPRLQDLVAALEQLKVPAEDRINIVKELHRSGRLHAKLIIDGVMP